MAITIKKSKFSSGINLDRFKSELATANLTGSIESIDDKVTDLFINGDDALNNTADMKTINDVVAAHDGTPDVDSALDNMSATTDPTTSDDINAGYSVGSRWVNTITGKGFLSTGNNSGAADWEETTPTLNKEYSYATNANAYINKNNLITSYENICMFPGEAKFKPISKITIISRGNLSGVIDVRIRDITNNLTIAEKTGMTHTVFTLMDLGIISNLPIADVILALQAQSSVAEDLYLAALCIEY